MREFPVYVPHTYCYFSYLSTKISNGFFLTANKALYQILYRKYFFLLINLCDLIIV